MRTNFNTVKLEKLFFEANDSSIQLLTSIYQGNLSYQSEIVIPSCELNKLLNLIQKELGQHTEVNSLIETEKMFDGNLMYHLDLNKNGCNTIEIQDIIELNKLKQIRA